MLYVPYMSQVPKVKWKPSEAATSASTPRRRKCWFGPFASSRITGPPGSIWPPSAWRQIRWALVLASVAASVVVVDDILSVLLVVVVLLLLLLLMIFLLVLLVVVVGVVVLILLAVVVVSVVMLIL